MDGFARKVERFWEIFYQHDGYKKVVTGLQNTVYIAVVGLALGILIGTLIAVIKVLPKYSKLTKALNGFCDFYVGLFRAPRLWYSFWWRTMSFCRFWG